MTGTFALMTVAVCLTLASARALPKPGNRKLALVASDGAREMRFTAIPLKSIFEEGK